MHRFITNIRSAAHLSGPHPSPSPACPVPSGSEKSSETFFDFNRNVTKSNRDAQFWSSKSKQAAEINAL
jgi:hypothetical protein